MGSKLQNDEILPEADFKKQVEQYAHEKGMTTAELIRKALEEYVANHPPAPPDNKLSLAEWVDSLTSEITAEEWALLPPDLAKNFDHYAYGYPRED